jgi:DNA-binding CsgD family transcriptional regulator
MGGVAILSGEAGIGKTALIGETLKLGRERGFQLLSGRAVALERDLPFAIFANAFQGRPDAWSKESTAADLPRGNAEVSSSGFRFEEWRDRAAPDERYELLHAVSGELEAMAGERPLLIALDDLHWADPASIDLVCHLLYRRMEGASLLLLASRLPQSEPRLRAAFDEAERQPGSLRMALAPLSSSEAEQLLGPEMQPSMRAAIYEESGGNPLFLEQLAGAARSGSITPKRAGHSGEFDVPPAVRAAIEGELNCLEPTGRTLLQGAALLAEPFDPGMAADTAGITKSEALVALDEAIDAKLIEPADSPRRFRFHHPIIRRTVHQTSPIGWRLSAHRRAADALEAKGSPPAVRAPHVEQAAELGDEAAVATLAMAGEETASRSPASAAHWFGAALDLLPEGDETLSRRLELLLGRAMALGAAGSIEPSREALGDFLALSPQGPSEARTQAAQFAAVLDELLGRQDTGRRLLVEELRRLPHPAGREAAKLKRELAFTAFFDADWGAMRRWAGEALEVECDGMTRIGALAAHALADLGLGDRESMLGSVRKASELFDGLADAEIAAHDPGIGLWLGWAEVCAERFDASNRHLERAIAISRSIGQRHLTVGLFAVQAQALAFKGDGEGLAAVAEAATEATLLTSSDLYRSWASTVQCQAAVWSGDLLEALRFGERALAAASTASTPQADLARVQLASALLESGEARRCGELLTLPDDDEPNLPPFPLFEVFGLELLVRSELVLGRTDRAAALLERAVATSQRLGGRLPAAQAHRARALLLFARGDFSTSAEEASASEEIAAEADSPVEAARSRVVRGTALAAGGDRKAALGALEVAGAQLLGCGAPRFADEAAQQLRKLGRDLPRYRHATGPKTAGFDLTKRESEVMERIADGRTNREIATELYLSVRTIDRHVSRIFAKLDVKSRAAAVSVYERQVSGSSSSAST